MLFKQFQIVASLVTLAGVMVFGIAFAGADEPHQIPKTPLPASAPTPPQNASAVVKKIRIDDAAITKYKNAGAKFYGLVPIAEADFLGGSRKLKNDEGKPNRIFGLIFKQVPRIESSWEATKLRTMRMPSHACRSKLFHL